MASGKDLGKAFEDFKREIRAELRSFKQSVEHCSESCDSVNALTLEMKTLREELVATRNSNEKLAAENKQLQMKIEELEQYSRANNLEIKGAPDEGEPFDTVQKICVAVGEPLARDDVDICHRVGTNKTGVKNIVVRFVRREKRNAVLAKSKKARLSTTAIGFRTTGPIYVNEHLTRQDKQLLGAANAKKREVGWRFVWTHGGKIFARKSESSDMLMIACREGLDKMKR
ncbi:hypothetical protein HPB49_010860 [Dermacentor silvarum]|uniref:Uncharacterized protein n=1 Tax=Dermacentor silvarum TaxID=543639 RepID=A0ACB8DZ12_DERSI|nr:hypothetical protein HPB49_010860 [Dermacentor silvarum]